MASLQLAQRLILAGRRISLDVPGWDDSEPVAMKAIKQMIFDTMTVSYFLVDQIYWRLSLELRATRQNISPGTRRELEAQAKRLTPWCFHCGVDLDFANKGLYPSFTLDHVWPQAFGGDSHGENLIPACKSCNERKAHTPTFALYPILGYMAGLRPEAHEIAELPKEFRLAVQAREVALIASANHISLKEAHGLMGPPLQPTYQCPDVTIDAFDLLPAWTT